MAEYSRSISPSENLGVTPQSLCKVLLVSDKDHAISATDKFLVQFAVTSRLGGIVVHRPVTEDADVGFIKEIGDAALWTLTTSSPVPVMGRSSQTSSVSVGRSTHSRLRQRTIEPGLMEVIS